MRDTFMRKKTNLISPASGLLLKGIVAESDNRQNCMLFKLSMEMAMMMNVVPPCRTLTKFQWNGCGESA